MKCKKMFFVGMVTVFVGMRCWSATNWQDSKYVALVEAIEQGCTVAALQLIKEGAPFDEKVLYVAANYGRAAVVDALLAKNNKSSLNAGVFYWGFAREGVIALSSAALYGHRAVIKVLLSGGVSLDAIIARYDMSALCYAAFQAKSKVVSILLDAYYDTLIMQCPLVVDMANFYLPNQIQSVLPSELLEHIVKELPLCDVANFRAACKYFRVLAEISFEKKRASQLKEDLIQSISGALCKARRNGFAKVTDNEQEAQDDTIYILERELKNAKTIQVNELVQGRVVFNGNQRIACTIIDSDVNLD